MRYRCDFLAQVASFELIQKWLDGFQNVKK